LINSTNTLNSNFLFCQSCAEDEEEEEEEGKEKTFEVLWFMLFG